MLKSPATLTVPEFARLNDYVGVWAMEPTAANGIWAIAQSLDMAAHVKDGAPKLRSDAQLMPAEGGKSVAVVRLNGTLMKGQTSFGGGTSTVQARRDIRKAAADPDVSAILLAIDSPGGTTAGTDDLAAEVRAAKAAKPVYAQVDDLCASAAYWVASQCDKVFANSDTALVGSIGTFLTLYDLSAKAEKDGVKALHFATGPLKGAGVPGAPVTDEQKAYFQGIVDSGQKSFDAAVKAGRHLSDQQFAAVRTGGVFSAPEAAARGLIDGVQSFDRTLSMLAAEGRRRGPTPTRKSAAPAVTPRSSAAMNPKFDQYVTDQGFDPAALSTNQKAHFQLAFEREAADALAAAEAKANEEVAGARKVKANELRRLAEIEKVCAGFPGIAADAIEKGWTVEKAENETLRAKLPKGVAPVNPHGPTIVAGGGGSQADAEVIEAAMCLTAGLKEDFVAAKLAPDKRERVMNVAAGSRFRGFGLHSLMDAVIQSAGHHYVGARKSNDYIRAALGAEKQLMASGGAGFTTVSLSGILSNVANKALNSAYSGVKTTWQEFCAVRNHGDFKVHTRYRLDSTGAFKKVAPDGELKQIGMADTAYTNKLDTYGCVVALNRQMMINDDLGAFLELPVLLGRMGALRIEEAVYVLLLSNANSFFSAGNKNLITGAGSAFSIAAVTAAEQGFVDQVDSNGKPILTTASVLVVPSTLGVPANKVHKDTTVIAVGVPTSAKNVEGNSNPHQGKYPPVVSPYLNNTGIKDQDGKAITGQSSVGWYLFADPAVRAALAVAFLNGNQTPTIESDESPFTTLGMQWRAYEDFGVGQEDPTAAQFSQGS